MFAIVSKPKDGDDVIPFNVDNNDCLCTLPTFVTLSPCIVAPIHIMHAYAIIGRINNMYAHLITFGYRPQVLPNIFLVCANVIMAFLLTFSTCGVHVKVLSRVSPKYLNVSTHSTG